jgi:hypothetical protein
MMLLWMLTNTHNVWQSAAAGARLLLTCVWTAEEHCIADGSDGGLQKVMLSMGPWWGGRLKP